VRRSFSKTKATIEDKGKSGIKVRRKISPPPPQKRLKFSRF